MLSPEQIRGSGVEVLISLVIANFLAQLIKTIIYSIQHRKLYLPMLFNTGGMPSSHSSSVVALSTSIGLIRGFDSVEFAIAFCLSAVVMYDSAGVRRSAGKQAEVLNNIIEELFSPDHKISAHKLKELLGHSPKEVLVGAILGIIVSIVIHHLLSH